MPAPRTRPRLEVLDGIRFLAALYVVVFHLSAGDRDAWQKPSSELFGPLFHVASYGWLGVELFFMISGFVICLSTWGKTFSQFAISRVVRLYPAYWFCVLLTTAVVLLVPSGAHAPSWSQVLENLTMTEAWARVPLVDPSYWTLAIELMFYLLVAVTLVSRGFTYARVVTFCSVWLGVSLLDDVIQSPWFTIIVLPVYAPYFIAGMLLYLMHKFGPRLQLWALLACSWGCAMYRLEARTAGQHPSGVTLNYWVSATIVTAFFAVLTLIALGKLRMIRGRWLVTAGALTYPLYLMHQEIGDTIIRSFNRSVAPWMLLAGVFAVMLILAWLTHRFVERPLAGRVRAVLYGGLAIIQGFGHTRPATENPQAPPQDPPPARGRHRAALDSRTPHTQTAAPEHAITRLDTEHPAAACPEPNQDAQKPLPTHEDEHDPSNARKHDPGRGMSQANRKMVPTQT